MPPRPNVSLGALVAVLAFAMAVLFVACRARNGGVFVYAVDDAYIHLAIARTLAEHGVYGPTPHESALASSSIGWPLLLAALPRHDLVPLALNAAAACALAVVLARSLRSALAAAAVLICIPIVPVVFVGMEHTAHVLAVVALALGWQRGASPWLLAFAAAAAAAMRYETAFVVAPLCIASLVARRWLGAVAIATGAALPVVAQAIVSGALLPGSVLLKRVSFELASIPRKFVEHPHVLVVLLLLALAWAVRREALLLVAMVTIVLHVAFAQLHWFYRYEAYVMALALVALALTWCEYARLSFRWAVAIPIAVAAVPLVIRGVLAVRATPYASSNIHDQQMQTARFLRDHYPGQTVVINDLGLVAWLGRSRIVDLMGLGSPAVARARGMRITGPLDASAIERLTRGAAVAVIYDQWFQGALPSSWTPVARFTIPDNRVCAYDTVTFYALARSEVVALTERVRSFVPQLPSRVKVVELSRRGTE